ncbi:hypothetical protein [Corticibacter populi]|uniref:hypothetical protein n=1 Tax=Corticibacter populi TaxID=1550736 RepID=UPI0013C36C61|nr:hypothetical protein [Corticibacter populi]
MTAIKTLALVIAGALVLIAAACTAQGDAAAQDVVAALVVEAESGKWEEGRDTK